MDRGLSRSLPHLPRYHSASPYRSPLLNGFMSASTRSPSQPRSRLISVEGSRMRVINASGSPSPHRPTVTRLVTTKGTLTKKSRSSSEHSLLGGHLYTTRDDFITGSESKLNLEQGRVAGGVEDIYHKGPYYPDKGHMSEASESGVSLGSEVSSDVEDDLDLISQTSYGSSSAFFETTMDSEMDQGEGYTGGLNVLYEDDLDEKGEGRSTRRSRGRELASPASSRSSPSSCVDVPSRKDLVFSPSLDLEKLQSKFQALKITIPGNDNNGAAKTHKSAKKTTTGSITPLAQSTPHVSPRSNADTKLSIRATWNADDPEVLMETMESGVAPRTECPVRMLFPHDISDSEAKLSIRPADSMSSLNSSFSEGNQADLSGLTDVSDAPRKTKRTKKSSDLPGYDRHYSTIDETTRSSNQSPDENQTPDNQTYSPDNENHSPDNENHLPDENNWWAVYNIESANLRKSDRQQNDDRDDGLSPKSKYDHDKLVAKQPVSIPLIHAGKHGTEKLKRMSPTSSPPLSMSPNSRSSNSPISPRELGQHALRVIGGNSTTFKHDNSNGTSATSTDGTGDNKADGGDKCIFRYPARSLASAFSSDDDDETNELTDIPRKYANPSERVSKHSGIPKKPSDNGITSVVMDSLATANNYLPGVQTTQEGTQPLKCIDREGKNNAAGNSPFQTSVSRSNFAEDVSRVDDQRRNIDEVCGRELVHKTTTAHPSASCGDSEVRGQSSYNELNEGNQKDGHDQRAERGGGQLLGGEDGLGNQRYDVVRARLVMVGAREAGLMDLPDVPENGGVQVNKRANHDVTANQVVYKPEVDGERNNQSVGGSVRGRASGQYGQCEREDVLDDQCDVSYDHVVTSVVDKDVDVDSGNSLIKTSGRTFGVNGSCFKQFNQDKIRNSTFNLTTNNNNNSGDDDSAKQQLVYQQKLKKKFADLSSFYNTIDTSTSDDQSYHNNVDTPRDNNTGINRDISEINTEINRDNSVIKKYNSRISDQSNVNNVDTPAAPQVIQDNNDSEMMERSINIPSQMTARGAGAAAGGRGDHSAHAQLTTLTNVHTAHSTAHSGDNDITIRCHGDISDDRDDVRRRDALGRDDDVRWPRDQNRNDSNNNSAPSSFTARETQQQNQDQPRTWKSIPIILNQSDLKSQPQQHHKAAGSEYSSHNSQRGFQQAEVSKQFTKHVERKTIETIVTTERIVNRPIHTKTDNTSSYSFICDNDIPVDVITSRSTTETIVKEDSDYFSATTSMFDDSSVSSSSDVNNLDRDSGIHNRSSSNNITTNNNNNNTVNNSNDNISADYASQSYHQQPANSHSKVIHVEPNTKGVILKVIGHLTPVDPHSEDTPPQVTASTDEAPQSVTRRDKDSSTFQGHPHGRRTATSRLDVIPPGDSEDPSGVEMAASVTASHVTHKDSVTYDQHQPGSDSRGVLDTLQLELSRLRSSPGSEVDVSVMRTDGMAQPGSVYRDHAEATSVLKQIVRGDCDDKDNSCGASNSRNAAYVSSYKINAFPLVISEDDEVLLAGGDSSVAKQQPRPAQGSELYDNDYDYLTPNSDKSQKHSQQRHNNVQRLKPGQLKASSLWTLQEETEMDATSPRSSPKRAAPWLTENTCNTFTKHEGLRMPDLQNQFSAVNVASKSRALEERQFEGLMSLKERPSTHESQDLDSNYTWTPYSSISTSRSSSREMTPLSDDVMSLGQGHHEPMDSQDGDHVSFQDFATGVRSSQHTSDRANINTSYTRGLTSNSSAIVDHKHPSRDDGAGSPPKMFKSSVAFSMHRPEPRTPTHSSSILDNISASLEKFSTPEFWASPGNSPPREVQPESPSARLQSVSFSHLADLSRVSDSAIDMSTPTADYDYVTSPGQFTSVGTAEVKKQQTPVISTPKGILKSVVRRLPNSPNELKRKLDEENVHRFDRLLSDFDSQCKSDILNEFEIVDIKQAGSPSNHGNMYKAFTNEESEKKQNHVCIVVEDEHMSTYRFKRYLKKSHTKRNKTGRKIMRFLSRLSCVSESVKSPSMSPSHEHLDDLYNLDSMPVPKHRRISRPITSSNSFHHFQEFDPSNSPNLSSASAAHLILSPTPSLSSPTTSPIKVISSPSSSNQSLNSIRSRTDSAYSSVSESALGSTTLGSVSSPFLPVRDSNHGSLLSPSTPHVFSPMPSHTSTPNPHHSHTPSSRQHTVFFSPDSSLIHPNSSPNPHLTTPRSRLSTFLPDATNDSAYSSCDVTSSRSFSDADSSVDASQDRAIRTTKGSDTEMLTALSDVLLQLDVCEGEIDTALLDRLRYGHHGV